jgi:hypothetical protein
MRFDIQLPACAKRDQSSVHFYRAMADRISERPSGAVEFGDHSLGKNLG